MKKVRIAKCKSCGHKEFNRTETALVKIIDEGEDIIKCKWDSNGFSYAIGKTSFKEFTEA